MIWDRISQTPKIEKNSDQSINQKKQFTMHSPTFAIEQVILSSYNSQVLNPQKRINKYNYKYNRTSINERIRTQKLMIALHEVYEQEQDL